MKRLISMTAAVLAICAAPAHAMDYVKCEAMNKAAGRLRVGSEKAVRADRRRVNALRSEACPQWSYDGKMSAKQMAAATNAQQACVSQWNATNNADWSAREDGIRAEYADRLAQVKKDYEAAGCY